MRGSTDAEFTAEALGWVPNDDETWTCPDCLRDIAEQLRNGRRTSKED